MPVGVKKFVEVWGRSCEVVAVQKSKSVWTASGYYLGVHVEGRGRTAAAAARSWGERARTEEKLMEGRGANLA